MPSVAGERERGGHPQRATRRRRRRRRGAPSCNNVVSRLRSSDDNLEIDISRSRSARSCREFGRPGRIGLFGGEGKEGDGPGVPYMILAAHPLPPTQNVSRILVCFWTCHPEGDAITQAWTNALGARVPGMAASRRGSLALPPCAQG